ncbi:MAG: carboxylate-amine ligase [Fimbriimonadaceae bacterium]|jgi:carboxylate-amine ligase
METGFFTLGVEEEFQIVDPETGQLRSHIEQVMEQGELVLKESIRPEMHKSVVEGNTPVCQNMEHARNEVYNLRRELCTIANRGGLEIASAGSHPFSHWLDQEITQHARYISVVEEMQRAARRNLIFGLHVHVGYPDREKAIHLVNAASYFIPHILALSTNSPFWLGHDTGYKSYRLNVFDGFPRTGLPGKFNSFGEYEDYVELLVKTRCIDDPKRIWWDIRIHPYFDTIEFRMCDAQMRTQDTLALVGLVLAITRKLDTLLRNNLSFRIYRNILLEENRWRAMRRGLGGKLIDYGKQQEVDTLQLMHELLDFVEDVVDEMDVRPEIEYIRNTLLVQGTGADRQLTVYHNSGEDIKAVVDYIIDETKLGI